MAARRRKRAPQTEEYVEGNTVRKVERVPRYEEQERGHQQKRNVSHTVTVRRNQEKALQMNLFSVLLLTVAVICPIPISLLFTFRCAVLHHNGMRKWRGNFTFPSV